MTAGKPHDKPCADIAERRNTSEDVNEFSYDRSRPDHFSSSAGRIAESGRCHLADGQIPKGPSQRDSSAHRLMRVVVCVGIREVCAGRSWIYEQEIVVVTSANTPSAR